MKATALLLFFTAYTYAASLRLSEVYSMHTVMDCPNSGESLPLLQLLKRSGDPQRTWWEYSDSGMWATAAEYAYSINSTRYLLFGNMCVGGREDKIVEPKIRGINRDAVFVGQTCVFGNKEGVTWQTGEQNLRTVFCVSADGRLLLGYKSTVCIFNTTYIPQVFISIRYARSTNRSTETICRQVSAPREMLRRRLQSEHLFDLHCQLDRQRVRSRERSVIRMKLTSTG